MNDSFEQLSRQLDHVYSDEREIILQAIARVGSFEQLSRQLDHVYCDEREIILEAMAQRAEQPKKVATPLGKQFDVFIAHASEDKNFVTPLASALIRRGLKVWYDDFILRIGDSLRREVDRGLAESRYGIVVLSHNFFRKDWPQKELDGLAAKEELGKKVLLPVWHNIDKEEVTSYSPTLADIRAVKSSLGIETVASEIIKAISD